VTHALKQQHLFIAIASDIVHVTHMATYKNGGSRRTKGNGNFTAAEDTNCYDAAIGGSNQEDAGIRAWKQ
jgi:hypothetical protein